MLLDELHLNDFTSIKHLQRALKVVFMHVWPEEFSCTDPVLTSSASSVCDASKQWIILRVDSSDSNLRFSHHY